MDIKQLPFLNKFFPTPHILEYHETTHGTGEC